MDTDNDKTPGRNTVPVSVSMLPEEQEILQRAAAIDRRSLSSFVRAHVLPIAERIVAERQVTTPA